MLKIKKKYLNWPITVCVVWDANDNFCRCHTLSQRGRDRETEAQEPGGQGVSLAPSTWWMFYWRLLALTQLSKTN